MSTGKKVAITCQGGGSHAAFTAGVLQTVLLGEAEGTYSIMGFGGTSGGALSALLAWYGLLTGGTDKAVQLLNDLWRDNAAASLYERLYNAWVVAAARWPIEVKASPYEFPLSWALRYQAALAQVQDRWGVWGPRETFVELPSLLERYVAFEPGPAPRKVKVSGPPVRKTRLLIGAVDVLSGEFEAFDSEAGTASGGDAFDAGGISLEAILASAALPMIFRAVRIGERAYWDGLFSQNPPIKDFLAGPIVRTADEKPDEIWVVQVNPQTGQEPTSPVDIENRRNELAGNLSLNQEIRFIRIINKLLRELAEPESSGDAPGLEGMEHRGKRVYKPVDLYRITMDRERLSRKLGRRLDVASKLDRSAPIIEGLMAHGRERAAEFLAAWQAGVVASETKSSS